MMARPDVVVTDLDRTFTTEDLGLDPAALQAARRLRSAGLRCVLATGRGPTVLELHPELATAFDAFVLEGGALWGTPGEWRFTGDAAGVEAVWDLARELERLGVEVSRRMASLSIDRRAEDLLRRVPAAARCSLQPNRDRIDIAPAGVDKGRGVRSLLAHWGVPGARVLAVGDGENDIALFAASHYGVAVANAVPGLRAAAHEVAPHPASRGFAWLVSERLSVAG